MKNKEKLFHKKLIIDNIEIRSILFFTSSFLKNGEKKNGTKGAGLLLHYVKERKMSEKGTNEMLLFSMVIHFLTYNGDLEKKIYFNFFLFLFYFLFFFFNLCLYLIFYT